MTQASYLIANAGGDDVRAAINEVLGAIKSSNSDAANFPSSPVAGQIFMKELSATCHEYWRYDGSAWRITEVLNPTSGFWYVANDRKIRGLTLSNNGTDATNDIDTAVGVACAESDGFPMELVSAITKRLDAGWAVGTNQGGLDTGSIANNTYHVHLIRRPDTGVVDVLFSLSATSPTMPANYTQRRRIGSIIRESAAIVAFFQDGDIFRRAGVLDRNSTSAAGSALLALSVPAGIVVQPMLVVVLTAGASVTCNVALGSARVGATDTGVAQVLTGSGDTNDATQNHVPPIFSTNTSRQIYFAQTNTAGTPASSTLATVGWVDRRGQDS